MKITGWYKLSSNRKSQAKELRNSPKPWLSTGADKSVNLYFLREDLEETMRVHLTMDEAIDLGNRLLNSAKKEL